MRKSFRMVLAGVALGMGAVGLAAPASAAPTYSCFASPVGSLGANSWCNVSVHNAWVTCRRAATGSAYRVDGRTAAKSYRSPTVYCTSGDTRTGYGVARLT